MNSVKNIYGKFKNVTKKCRECYQHYSTFEEKRTDVNIALSLLIHALNDTYDTAYLVSGDSDLVPAIETVKRAYPSKKIISVLPIGRRSEEIRLACDGRMKMKEKHLRTCQLPDEIDLGDGNKIVRPSLYRWPSLLCMPNSFSKTINLLPHLRHLTSTPSVRQANPQCVGFEVAETLLISNDICEGKKDD